LQRQSSKSVVSERYYRLQVRLFETLVKLNTDGGISTRRMWNAARRKRRHGSKFACCIPAVCLAETFRLHPVRYPTLDPKQFTHYLHSPSRSRRSWYFPSACRQPHQKSGSPTVRERINSPVKPVTVLDWTHGALASEDARP
jgi:hypothetical protein